MRKQKVTYYDTQALANQKNKILSSIHKLEEKTAHNEAFIEQLLQKDKQK